MLLVQCTYLLLHVCLQCERLNEIPPGRLVDSLNRLGISKQTYTQGIKIYPIKTRSVEELLGEPGFLCG